MRPLRTLRRRLAPDGDAHLLVRVHVLRRCTDEHVCPNCGGELVRGRAGGVSGARHLYVHLPFCAHRCGYCDFVTVVGDGSTRYVDALLRELELERGAARDRARDGLPRRRHADVHRARRARAAARGAARRPAR